MRRIFGHISSEAPEPEVYGAVYHTILRTVNVALEFQFAMTL